MVIDARGQACPKPVMMAEEAVSKIGEGIVEVLVDNEASVKNLSRFAKNNALYAETEKVDDYWKVKIVKGYPCEIAEEEEKPLVDKGVFLIIGTDVMGKDEDIGRVLMKGFFETMKVTKELPQSIFFLNKGVMLTTTDTEIIPVLKELEYMGVEIYSCGTCLKHYGLESELKVGHRGTTNHIIEGLKEFKKVVWI
jgi:selenium metabolism protein YedF